MMKFVALLSVLALLLGPADAFASVSRRACHAKAFALYAQSTNDNDAVLSRREAMRKSANLASLVAVASVVATPETALADIYDEQEKERKRKAKEDAENAKKLVPGILIGGTLLSVPFFFPNLVRLGKKFASLGEDDGYGS